MGKILLVEDEVLIRELAAEQLVEEGFIVTALRNGDEAASVLDEGQHFDLLFTDIRMPGNIDGWNLAHHARRLLPEVKVLYATGLSDPDANCVENGRLMTKPYVFGDVLAAIRELGIKPAT